MSESRPSYLKTVGIVSKIKGETDTLNRWTKILLKILLEIQTEEWNPEPSTEILKTIRYLAKDIANTVNEFFASESIEEV